jgi:flagellar FliL protein
MAEDDLEREEESAPKRSRSFAPVKLGILVLLLALLGGGSYVGYTKFFKPPGADAKQAEVAKTVSQEMGSFLVNLSDPGGKRYLKIAMQLELSDQKASEEINNRNAEVRDMILMILSGKEFSEIATPVGKTILKRELLSKMNKMLRDGQVKEIYFSEFLVQ